MKILLTCDPEIPVPPTNYGGIERIVDGLAKGYSQLGHEVYLIAHPESICKYTKKNFSWPSFHSGGMWNIVHNSLYLRKVVKKIKPDVIHSFSRLLYMYPLFLNHNLKIIQSYQRSISHKSTSVASIVFGKKIVYTACGAHMLKHLSSKKFNPIHNFTDTEFYQPLESKTENRLIFLGRIEDIKGTEEAIKVALACDMELIIAGNIPNDQKQYFDERISPYLSNSQIKFVGPVNDDQKKHWLQTSKALLFPIKWEEPFGIVIAESLACGTPIIGFRRGSVPEVIIDGKTGFVVDTIEEMIEKVKSLDLISRVNCRQSAEQRFDISVITKRYSALFNFKK